jgi:glycosyltransferase involved in cell wall biosynthesis
MLDRTIKAFAIIAKQIPEAVLFMHCDAEDAAAIFDLRALAFRLGVLNRLRFTGVQWHKALDYDEMNSIYNAMDVFFLSTSGEGFGIPIVEAMSCGVPVIATDYTTTEELVRKNDAGIGVPLVGCEEQSLFDQNVTIYDQTVTNGTITGSWMVERGMIDVVKAANAIVGLSKDADARARYGRNGRKAALDKYDWEKVADQWDAFLTGLVEW